MPARYATARYPDPIAFLRAYQSTLKRGALLLPPGALDDEPAPEMKVDLIIPGTGRVGPLEAQLVNKMPDGSVALRLGELPAAVMDAARGVEASIAAARDYLLETRQVALPTRWTEADVRTLEARIAELEAALAAAEVAKGELARALAVGGGMTAPTSSEPARARRGFPVPDVSGREPRFAGDMADQSLRDAFMTLAVERVTGLLTIHGPDGRTRWGFWSKGGVVGWRTEPVEESEVLGVLLYRANQITKEQLARSLEVMEERGCRQGEALIELGWLTFAQLVILLQKQNDFVLQRVLGERIGTWTFHTLEEHAERFVPPPARVAAVLFRALRGRAKELAPEELASTLRPNLDRYVYVRPGVERVLEEMRLTNDETGFLKIISATSYRLREMSSVSNLSRSQTAAMIWCLNDLGLIEFRGDEASARVNERVSRDLLSRKSTFERGTLFDRLELHWICTTPEVEAAWARLRPLFGPEQAGRFGEDWRRTMELIGRGMLESYEKLRVDSARREYRASVVEKSMIEQSALMLAGKGDMAFMRDANKEAFDCFSKAVELVPNRPEFLAGLQKARAGGGG